MSLRNTIFVMIGVVAVLAAAMVGWKYWPHPVAPKPLATAEYLQTIATQGTQALSKSEPLRVRAPLFGAEVIGTLVYPDGDVPVSRGCRITAEPVVQTPNGFPPQSYHLQRNAGVDISQGLMRQIVAHLNLGANETVDLAFDDAKAHLLYDDDIVNMAETPECQAILAGRQLWIVRGYIEAKRSLTISGGTIDKSTISRGDDQYQVDIGSDSSSVSIIDKNAVPLFEIISAVSVPQSGGKAVLAQPADTPQATIATTITDGKTMLATVAPVQKVPGLIYFQRDAGDRSGNDAKLQGALRNAGLPVEPIVQKMAPDRLPRQANVRYFNATDEAAATKVLAIVRQTYPDAVTKRLPFRAPLGQMEVWLPPAG